MDETAVRGEPDALVKRARDLMREVRELSVAIQETVSDAEAFDKRSRDTAAGFLRGSA